MSLQNEIIALRADALAALKDASPPDTLETWRIKYLGTKGLVKKFMERMGEVSKAEKPAVGKVLNDLKNELTTAFERIQVGASDALKPSGLAFDVTDPLPPERVHVLGKKHPLTRTVDELRGLLRALGFEVTEGPEVEDARHNFDDLNIPPDHPSRDSFDTFFLSKDALLRSQTSTVQVRIMETRKPPVRVIAPGRVYRPDLIDATHHSTFHQIEGLYVDRGVSMADLKGTLQLFVEGLFGTGTRMRFRPSFFPFTEPSAEMDCSCPGCGGPGCTVCKQTGWVELGGCGMVDPAVFEAINRSRGDKAYDPEIWTGFAFGFGIERLAMRRHGITDIRRFLENDLRFLRNV